MLGPGDIIADRYEVESLIGEGGLSQVWRVRHRDLGSLHALKMLVFRKPRLAERLMLEGRIQAQLRHPHVVTVTDIVRHDGQVGLVMEYVAGESLERWLDANAPADVDVALELMAPILSGVRAAHQRGVLHRDLKPANILLERHGRAWVPKVTDFGIAKVFEGEHDGVETRVGAVLGTPGYLAPEQATDASKVDQRADVFALGAIVYEMVTGHLAFQTQDPFITPDMVPEPVRELRPGLPEHVAAAIDRALAWSPDARFSSVSDFAAALLEGRPALLEVVESDLGSESPLALTAPRPVVLPERAEPDAPPATPPPPASAQPPPAAHRPPPWSRSAMSGTLSGAEASADPRTEEVSFEVSRGGRASWTGRPLAVDGDGYGEIALHVPTFAVEPASDGGDTDDLDEEEDAPTPPDPGGARAWIGRLQVAGVVLAALCGAALGLSWMGGGPPGDATPVPPPPADAPPTPAALPAGPPPPPSVQAPSLPTSGAGWQSAGALQAARDADGSPPPASPPSAPPPSAYLPSAPAAPDAAAGAGAARGSWSGRAGALPLELTIATQPGGGLSGELVLAAGAATDRYRVSGKIGPDGAFTLRSAGGDVVLQGRVDGGKMSGTYGPSGGRNPILWTAERR